MKLVMYFPFHKSVLYWRYITQYNFVSKHSHFNEFPANFLSSLLTPKLSQRFSTKSKNYYDILGITPKASQDEIKAAYFKLSKLHHPDVTKDNSDSVEKFRQVTEAYEFLSNAKFRKQYDADGLNLHDLSNVQEIMRQKRMKTKVYTGRSSIYNYDEWMKGHYTELFKRTNEVKTTQQEFDRRLRDYREHRFRKVVLLVGTTIVGFVILILIGIMEFASQPYHGPDPKIITKGKSKRNDH